MRIQNKKKKRKRNVYSEMFHLLAGSGGSGKLTAFAAPSPHVTDDIDWLNVSRRDGS